MSVKVPSANFREKPSTNATIMFSADKYYPVEIVKKQNGWVQVRDFEGDEAWVAERLLGREETVVISSDRVNVREKDNTSADVLFKAERGEVFKVLERKGRWLHLSDPNGEKGWIREDLVWGEHPVAKDDEGAKGKDAPKGKDDGKAAEGDKKSPKSKDDGKSCSCPQKSSTGAAPADALAKGAPAAASNGAVKPAADKGEPAAVKPTAAKAAAEKTTDAAPAAASDKAEAGASAPATPAPAKEKVGDKDDKKVEPPSASSDDDAEG